MTIREARAEEADSLLAFWDGAGAEPTTTDSLDDVRQLFGRPDTWVLVAEESGAWIASLLVSFDGWRGHFYRLAVLPAFRRRGIATALVRQGEELLAGAGARRLTAIVVDADGDAADFWRSAGFECQTTNRRFVKLR